MDYIKKYFDTLNITITPTVCQRMHQITAHWEIKGTHPLTLNGQTLGVYRVVFTDNDRTAFFHCVDLEEPDVKHVVRECSRAATPSPIDLSRKVTSDPFNLLAVYLIYKAYQDLYKKDKRLYEQFVFNTLKYLHYKFFASLVNHYFPHGANEEIFNSVLVNLNKRFDIVTLGSWRAVIEDRCKVQASLDHKINIHWKTFETFTPDAMILYIISDTQTRLRDKIGIIRDMYYNYHGEGNKLKSESALGTDMDGETILVERNTTLDTALTSVQMDLLSVNTFINNNLMTLLLRQFNDVSEPLMRHALESLANKAAIQMKERKIDDVKHLKDGMVEYIGVRPLIRDIVLSSFEYCVKNGINIQSKTKVFQTILSRYRASHMKDPKVISIKNAMGDFVISLRRVSRPSTQSSLRLALILYVLAKALMKI